MTSSRSTDSASRTVARVRPALKTGAAAPAAVLQVRAGAVSKVVRSRLSTPGSPGSAMRGKHSPLAAPICAVAAAVAGSAGRARDLRLVRPHVEGVQHLSGTHIRSDVERSSVDAAVDSSTHFHEVAGVRTSGIFAIGRDVFTRDVKDVDFWRGRWSRLGGRFPTGGREQSDRYGDEKDPRRRPVGTPPRRRPHKHLLPAVINMMTV